MKQTIFFLLGILLFFTFSCRTIPAGNKKISKELMGQPSLSAEQLASFFLEQRPDFDRTRILEFAKLYITESAAEGINSDVAFAQMCLETGYLKFGNLVLPEMHNYCGLGAIDESHPGEWFETEEIGVRAHIQHLQAYATTEDVELKNPLVDPRYGWVHKTKFARTIHDLTGNWASDNLYDKKIDAILKRMSFSARKNRMR